MHGVGQATKQAAGEAMRLDGDPVPFEIPADDEAGASVGRWGRKGL